MNPVLKQIKEYQELTKVDRKASGLEQTVLKDDILEKQVLVNETKRYKDGTFIRCSRLITVKETQQ